MVLRLKLRQIFCLTPAAAVAAAATAAAAAATAAVEKEMRRSFDFII